MITRRSFLSTCAVLTGSVAFGVATHNSDEDWLISASDALRLGVPLNDKHWDQYMLEGFSSYREGGLNLIIYWDEKCHVFRDCWMRAHEHCMVERPRKKSRRIKIFRHYLYGEALA